MAKTRFVQHYGDSVVIANREGKEDVLYFSESANSLLYDFYRQSRLENDEDEKLRILKLAANLVKSDINEMVSDGDTYFKFNDLNNAPMASFVLETLRLFIDKMFPRRSKPDNFKIAAIGQAIMKTARPNSINCPLLLSLAVEMHHKSGGSEFVVDLLHATGLGSSIEKVREFEKSLRFHESSSITSASCEVSSGTTLYSADNADIIQALLDGKNSIHMMGIVRSYIRQGSFFEIPIHIKKNPTKEELFKFSIPFQYTSKIDKSEISNLLKPISSLHLVDELKIAIQWDIFRLMSNKDILEWSGFMRVLTKKIQINEKHTVEFLPFVDLYPNNVSTMYTTLLFVINECSKHEVDPVIY